MTPACMTPRELELWREADSSMRNGRPSTGLPCFDCPLTFARAMRAEGCCNGQPGVPRRMEPGKPKGTPWRYSTSTERVEARRQSWRMSKRRARERAFCDNESAGTSSEPVDSLTPPSPLLVPGSSAAFVIGQGLDA